MCEEGVRMFERREGKILVSWLLTTAEREREEREGERRRERERRDRREGVEC